MNNQPFNKLIFPSGLIFLLLIILVSLTLIIVSDIVAPIFSWFRDSFIEENSRINFIPPVSIILRAYVSVTSLYLLFVLYSVLSAIYSYNSYKTAAKDYFFKEHGLSDIIFRGLRWNFYRLYYILLPPFMVGALGIILFLLALVFFNTVIAIAGISIWFISFLTVFIFTSLLFGFFASLAVSFRNMLVTVFGMACAVSEPAMSNDVIKKRARRLAFAISSNYVLYAFYYLFILALTVQFLSVIFFPEFIILENLIPVLMIVILDAALFLALGYLKSSSYLDSVLHQYKKVIINRKNILKKSDLANKANIS